MADGLTAVMRETAGAGPPGAADRRLFLAVMGLLVALAWFTLWVWEQSPYGRYLDHGRWTEIGLAANICRVVPGGEVVIPALLYVGGWNTNESGWAGTFLSTSAISDGASPFIARNMRP